MFGRCLSLFVLAGVGLLLNVPQAQAAYGAQICKDAGYKCVKVKKGQSWAKMFPNASERDLVMRLNRMNLKLFVINNDGYVSIRNTQLGFFGGPYFATTRETGVSMPPLDKLAAAYGLPYIDCANRAGLRAALEECLAAEGPVVCGITAQEDQQIIPTVSSVRLPNGQMQSKPLHDMFPFMAEDELQANMRA